jgi:hypothetical protein
MPGKNKNTGKGKKADKVKKEKASKKDKKEVVQQSPPDGQMSHVQIISKEKKLTVQETADCGSELAQEELQLDQVRKEKKETNRGFDTTIKDHLVKIMQLSQAIDTGILTTNIECDVVLEREKERKVCYPKSGEESFILPMTPDDYDLLT